MSPISVAKAGAGPPAAGGALARFVSRAGARRQEAVERCDMCGLPVAERHRHVLDEHSGELMCTCQACSLLFERDAAGHNHYKLVPRRRIRLDTGELPEAVRVPVGLAYFIRHGDGAVIAYYPSPMGVTESHVADGTWQALVERWPMLGEMEPLVEALLVNTARGADQRWLVPLDDCYRLVALIRREWRGLSGGRQVWPEISRFFEELGPPTQGHPTASAEVPTRTTTGLPETGKG